MAALVSHAMRRYPSSPSDGVYSSYNLKADNISWSQTTPEESESSLSRSMRYADPWLYGSVRGAPPGALVLAPAFVLCSCPDYLNGTKKAAQKKGPTVCKKCKGTRVALAPGNGDTKFGTVRCYPTSSSSTALHSISITTQVRAGTVRVTSSTRPSILPNTADPYDLMRRSRLNASSEATSPFRGRSVSPTKRSNGSSRSSGRRSILECDINPYELMSTETEQTPKDSSITFVNGQRIRVRPQAPDPDYEDIDDNTSTTLSKETNSSNDSCENVIHSPRPKPNRIAPDPPCVSPLLANEADRNNQFKSILKKSSNFNDTVMHMSKPCRQKNGSHFYLPLPNTPRKKVQFLVECSENNIEGYNDSVVESSGDYEDVEPYEDVSADYPEVFEEDENVSSEASDDNKICTLRRTTSERFKVEPQKVVFLDTMALRVKTPRGDSRETFNNCDLQKLDGLVPKRKISPRPKDPPPLPPPQDNQEKCTPQEETTKKEISTSVHEHKNELAQKTTDEKSQEHDQRIIKQSSKEVKVPLERKEHTSPKSTKDLAKEINESFSKALNADDSEKRKITSTNARHKNESKKLQLESDRNFEMKKTSSDKELKLIASDKTNEISDVSGPQIKPRAPPRKRSNNKMPNLNIQITTEDQLKNDKLESDEEIYQPINQNKSFYAESECRALRKRSNTNESANSQTILQQNTNVQNIDREPKMAETEGNQSAEESLMETVSNIEQKPQEFGGEPTNMLQNKPSAWNLKNFNTHTRESKVDDYPNKTVVLITPSSPVHRIQIKNEFPEAANVQTISILDNAQRKTSIMINGDDCYSTVNVSDDVPLYQSSVVVRDHGVTEFVPKFNRRSSSVYITGSFNEEFSPNISVSKALEEVKNDLNSSETCVCKQANNKEVTKEEKIDKEVSTDDIREESGIRPSTPDMLREILRDPVEAVKRNLVPHICGKSDVTRRPRDLKLKNYYPMFAVKELIPGTLDSKENSFRDIDRSPLRRCNFESLLEDDKDACSEHSSSTQYEFVDPGSDCYTDHSNRSSVTEEELANRTKFYELLADSALLEVSENEDHHYECINKNDSDPIYEEIEIPPPLPANPPPVSLLDDLKLDKEFTTRSIFEGASKYDILSYLVDAKERGIVPEDSYTFSSISNDESKERNSKTHHLSNVSDSSEDNSLVISGALIDDKTSFPKNSEVERNDSGVGSETSKSSLSKYRSKPVTSASCEDCESPLESLGEDEPMLCRKCSKKRSERKEIIMEIVETEEKYSKDLQIVLEEFYQPMLVAGLLTPEQLSTIFLNVEELLENSQSLAERLRDAVEIALEQGDEDLLTVNIGKLFLEAAPMLHAFETYCVRQGPASLLLASLEKEKELLRIFLRVSQMENTLLRRMNLNSFLMVPVQRVTKYPLLLARLYKVTPNHNEAREQLKEAQHKIELHLNHMNSQTKDVPSKLWRRIGSSSGRRPSTEMDLVNIKLRKIAVDVLEWNHEEAKFALEGKLWFTQPTDNNWRKGRTIKLSPVNALLVINGKTNVQNIDREPKMAETKGNQSAEESLMETVSNIGQKPQEFGGEPTNMLQNKPSAWNLKNFNTHIRESKPTNTSKTEREENALIFPKHSPTREAALLLVRDKNGRYSLLRDPLYLDRCVIASDAAWQSYFEVQELLGKDTFIFKAEDEDQTKIWYQQLQFHAQGMGSWRKRRNALANIMMNGMGLRL